MMGKGERKAMEQGREGLDLVAAAERQREVGKLFRVAMMKKWQGVPIEYARSQTETPPRYFDIGLSITLVWDGSMLII